MLKRPIIIAIDGYSSTGKSSFAKLIAAKYGLLYLDSGALYRAVTLYAMKNGIAADGNIDKTALIDALPSIDLRFRRNDKGSSVVILNGENVEGEIRGMDVSALVSPVSAVKEVRNFVDKLLHEYGRAGGIVMDGRDIGTTVFPDADLKIFMVATPEVRARRRAAEYAASGQSCDFDEVLANLKDRDYYDSHRDVSPLSKAEDAIVLDNTDMTLDDQLSWVGEILNNKFGFEK